MWILVFRNLIGSFKRLWKLYLTNIFSVLIIIVLFAYIDGSRRQLNLQQSAYAGDVVVKLKKEVPGIEQKLKKNIPGIKNVTKKIRTDVRYRKIHTTVSGEAELVGVDLKQDKVLRNFLTLKKGGLLKKKRDILVPVSLLQKMDISIGDRIRIIGKNADEYMNSASFKVAGIYNSPTLTFFNTPKFLIRYDTMYNFYQPYPKDIEYCLNFKNQKAMPENIDFQIYQVLQDTNHTLVDSIDLKQLNMMDVLNFQVQFNVFMIVLITLLILLIFTIVVLVNFNIYTIIYRKNTKVTGTLLAMGVKQWKIALVNFLESMAQLLVSTLVAVALALIASLIFSHFSASGPFEVLFVLLSGTNRIDLYIKPYQILKAFEIVFLAIVLAQLPLLIKLILKKPIEMLQARAE